MVAGNPEFLQSKTSYSAIADRRITTDGKTREAPRVLQAAAVQSSGMGSKALSYTFQGAPKLLIGDIGFKDMNNNHHFSGMYFGGALGDFDHYGHHDNRTACSSSHAGYRNAVTASLMVGWAMADSAGDLSGEGNDGTGNLHNQLGGDTVGNNVHDWSPLSSVPDSQRASDTNRKDREWYFSWRNSREGKGASRAIKLENATSRFEIQTGELGGSTNTVNSSSSSPIHVRFKYSAFEIKGGSNIQAFHRTRFHRDLRYIEPSGSGQTQYQEKSIHYDGDYAKRLGFLNASDAGSENGLTGFAYGTPGNSTSGNPTAAMIFGSYYGQDYHLINCHEADILTANAGPRMAFNGISLTVNPYNTRFTNNGIETPSNNYTAMSQDLLPDADDENDAFFLDMASGSYQGFFASLKYAGGPIYGIRTVVDGAAKNDSTVFNPNDNSTYDFNGLTNSRLQTQSKWGVMYAGHFSAGSTFSGSSYGVYAAGSTYAVYASGDIAATGNITAYVSDKRLKEDLKIIDNPIDKIKALTGYTFTWNSGSVKERIGTRDAGLIAQDVEKVLPEAVGRFQHEAEARASGSYQGELKTVHYDKIIPLLVETVKKQQNQIESLQDKIIELENKFEVT